MIRQLSLSVFSIVLLYGIYLLILLSLPYLQFKRGVDFLQTKELIYHLNWWRYSFYVHVFSSPIVIVAGFLQFSKYLLNNFPKLHRFLGKTYLIVLLGLAAPSGLLIGLYANGGYFTQIMFVSLSLCWIVTGILAYHFARKKEFEIHGKWMLRNYALTLSAITLRFYAYLLGYFSIQLGQVGSYQLLSVISWIPNLIVAEILIYFGFVRYYFKKSVR